MSSPKFSLVWNQRSSFVSKPKICRQLVKHHEVWLWMHPVARYQAKSTNPNKWNAPWRPKKVRVNLPLVGGCYGELGHGMGGWVWWVWWFEIAWSGQGISLSCFAEIPCSWSLTSTWIQVFATSPARRRCGIQCHIEPELRIFQLWLEGLELCRSCSKTGNTGERLGQDVTFQ